MTGSPGRRLWDVGFTGIPFAVFKLGGGIAAHADIHPLVGWGVQAWGALDLLLNLVSLLLPGRVGHCLLSTVGRFLDQRRGGGWREQAFLAVDTLLAFGIVSTMIWFERIGGLPQPLPRLWTLAVIASLLGVGVQRVWLSFRDHPRGGPGLG